ncbi:MAG: hypothetical protein WCD70_02360 [Alphaproteobacteria bacterium]
MTNNHLTRVSFRVKPDERKRIVADAKLAGMTMGSYARSRLLEAPETKTVYRRTMTKRLMTKLIGDIGRVGNNMNQIAFKMNSDIVLSPLDKHLHEEGVRALKEMRAALITHLLKNGPC